MISNALKIRMDEMKIDIPLTERILNTINDPSRKEPAPVMPRHIPGIDGTRVIDRRNLKDFTLEADRFSQAVKEWNIPQVLVDTVIIKDNTAILKRETLEALGSHLLPLVSYGVLNGGSASSYADNKKNLAFSAKLQELCGSTFERAADLCRGKAKGITPAFIHPDGSPGPSFMELKMRAVLIQVLRHQRRNHDSVDLLPLAPLFQMTSVLNDESIGQTLKSYRESSLLKELIDATGMDVTDVMTGIQPLVAAFTPEGPERQVFSTAFGKENEPLPFPGGHGQNFAVLKDIYRELNRRGKRFVYLGNVDNLGNLPDPVGVAILALGGKDAAFDFSFKTPVDVKGGILVEDQKGRLNCADIGVAIPKETVEEKEREGTPILFNCATGLFNLDVLVNKLEAIIADLPLRTSIQDKDPGRYAQTEQVTWEIIGMLNDFYIYGVEKTDRFLASKLLLENLLTSGIALDHPEFPAELLELGQSLNAGLVKKLTADFGLVEREGRWEPLSPEELL